MNEPEREPEPHAKQHSNVKRGLGGLAFAIGLAIAKFKAILAVLLSFKWIFLGTKFFLSFGSIFVSIWAYALVWGWKLGVAFVLVMLIHELGHWYAARSYGLDVSLPYFIPGLGAFVAMKQAPASGVHDAVIAIAGPLAGTAASAILSAYGALTGNAFWFAAAHIGFLLNAFNLIPVLPLDGGRVAGVISTRIWLFGLIAIAAFIVATGGFRSITSLIIIVLIVAFVPRAIAAWRGAPATTFPDVTPRERGAVAFAYFALLGLCGLAAVASNVAV